MAVFPGTEEVFMRYYEEEGPRRLQHSPHYSCAHTPLQTIEEGEQQEVGEHSGSAGSQCTQEAQLWEVLRQ